MYTWSTGEPTVKHRVCRVPESCRVSLWPWPVKNKLANTLSSLNIPCMCYSRLSKLQTHTHRPVHIQTWLSRTPQRVWHQKSLLTPNWPCRAEPLLSKHRSRLWLLFVFNHDCVSPHNSLICVNMIVIPTGPFSKPTDQHSGEGLVDRFENQHYVCISVCSYIYVVAEL